jgi:hypothetical protein
MWKPSWCSANIELTWLQRMLVIRLFNNGINFGSKKCPQFFVTKISTQHSHIVIDIIFRWNTRVSTRWVNSRQSAVSVLVFQKIINFGVAKMIMLVHVSWHSTFAYQKPTFLFVGTWTGRTGCWLQMNLQQWSGWFLNIIGWDPSICKSNRLHVEILRFSFIKLGYIL